MSIAHSPTKTKYSTNPSTATLFKDHRHNKVTSDLGLPALSILNLLDLGTSMWWCRLQKIISLSSLFCFVSLGADMEFVGGKFLLGNTLFCSKSCLLV